jgi:hypothetical protein
MSISSGVHDDDAAIGFRSRYFLTTSQYDSNSFIVFSPMPRLATVIALTIASLSFPFRRNRR